jgi:fructokinase
VYFFSRISNDFFGKNILNFLKKNKVNTSLVQRTYDSTTVGFISNKIKPEFSFYANQTADRNLKKYFFKKNIINKITLAHFSSISLVLKPGSETYFKMMQNLKSKCLISIDPNIRSSLIKNKKKYLKRFNNFLKIADIIKLSDEDFFYLNSKKKPNEVIPNWIKKNNIIFIIFTKGERGSILYTKNLKINIKPFKVKVKDTVGAGDIYHAALIHYLYKSNNLNKKKLKNLTKKDWLKCLDFASKASAICCTKEGCYPPTENEIIKSKLTQK